MFKFPEEGNMRHNWQQGLALIRYWGWGVGEFWLHISTKPTEIKAPMFLSTSLFQFPDLALEVGG